MFDATRLLGGLIDTGIGGGSQAAATTPAGASSGPGWGTVGAVAGVAAVGGLAYAAYRHHKAGGFGQGGPGLFGGPPQAPPHAQPQPPPQAAGPFGGGFGGAPSPFGVQEPAGFAGAQPPGGFAPPAFTSAQGAGFGQPTPAPQAAPVAQPAPQAAPSSDQQAQALLLVRAMIAAAHIDGRVDADEQQRILRGAEQAGFGPAERQALERELASPHPPNVLLGQARDPEIAAQFYLVTLLAIQLDSEVEKTYARALPLILQIPQPRVAEIHQQLGVAAL